MHRMQVEARLRPAAYNKVKFLWRGMKNRVLDTDEFFAEVRAARGVRSRL